MALPQDDDARRLTAGAVDASITVREHAAQPARRLT
jgi:hypothetical protein